MPKEAFAIIVVAVSAVVFVVVTILNAKTKVPEGIELPEKCEGCKMACSYKEQPLTKEVIEQINQDLQCQEQGENTHESE